MKLCIDELDNIKNSLAEKIKTPVYDIKKIKENTEKTPKWLHFGAGNIFRAYIEKMDQILIEKGLENTGIIVAESFDTEIIDKVYTPYNNLTMLVTLYKDGAFKNEIIGSIVDTIKADEEKEKLKKIAITPSLQIISFTITEKGYNLKTPNGDYIKVIEDDFSAGPDSAKHIMSLLTSLLYTRYKAGKLPVSMVSMDNCSGNGDKIKAAVLDITKHWIKNNYVEEEFISYLTDETKITFSITMIDKITPRPAEVIEKHLEKLGFENMDIVVTSKNSYTAPFVNAEAPQYFIVEDKFPNGRPQLELSEAGVYITDRKTVEKTERMKVTTCLNPLHTTLAVYGCIFNYKTIYDTVNDPLLNKLIKKIGYNEALKVVENPGILDPKAFIDEVVNERFPNPYIPDQPERIATDTSQKMGIRFGETIKAYMNSSTLKVSDLKYIPLVYAGWFRYLLGIDDQGNTRSISSDPMLEILQKNLAGIEFGNLKSYTGQLRNILRNKIIFGVNLEEVGLADLIEEYFVQMLAGKDAVRNTLKKYLND